MFSALEIFLVMRYINLLFTYLVTYLLTYLATNIAYLVSFRGHRKLIAICEKYAAEFGKLACGIWKNLPRKTVVPKHNLTIFTAERCHLATFP